MFPRESPAATRLGYGAANLGNLFRPMNDDESWQILDTAWECGIRFFDTAPHYGLGLSERRLGAFLRTKPREEFVLSTKVGRLLRPNPHDDGGLDLGNDFHVPTTMRREWSFSEDGIRTSLEESLDRLGLDRVDILYLHDPERHDLDLAIAEALPALESLRDEGVVAEVGVGAMTTDALTRTVESAQLNVIMVAGRYTLLEQPAEADVFPACRERGTDVVVASVFNSGLLARAHPRREDRYEYGLRLPDDMWSRLEKILAICAEHGVALSAAALQFPLRDGIVRSVVVGGSRPEQLRQNVDQASVAVPAALWDDLVAAELIPPVAPRPEDTGGAKGRSC